MDTKTNNREGSMEAEHGMDITLMDEAKGAALVVEYNMKPLFKVLRRQVKAEAMRRRQLKFEEEGERGVCFVCFGTDNPLLAETHHTIREALRGIPDQHLRLEMMGKYVATVKASLAAARTPTRRKRSNYPKTIVARTVNPDAPQVNPGIAAPE